jgi:hypothetical protein
VARSLEAHVPDTSPADPADSTGYGYQWWTYDDGSFTARGIFGQGIFIDPKRKLVIVSNANWGGGARDKVATEARSAFYREVQKAIDDESDVQAKCSRRSLQSAAFRSSPNSVVRNDRPPGVGLGMKPPLYLKKGDVMTLGIEGLGEQRQVVVPFKL